MKYWALRNKVSLNLFNLTDIVKLFPQESQPLIRVQLSRFAKKGLITKIKRGWYCFDPKKIDQFELAGLLYQPSYISLETALNYFGLIPDISQAVTSVTLTTTKKITNDFGIFYYNKVSQLLFWGFTKIKSAQSKRFFNLAYKEKALLDYFYLRKIKNIADLRLNLDEFDFRLYQKWVRNFPLWVQKINLNE